jgi:glycine cleavage system H lipoate-binding protein
MLGFREIEHIAFNDISGIKLQGYVIATIKYKDYTIAAHMPVDGKIEQINDSLLSANPNILLQNAENTGWIALVRLMNPEDRKNLLRPKQYHMNSKNRYARIK